MKDYGLVEVASVIPNEIKIGNPRFNSDKIISLIKNICNENEKNRSTKVVVFPELCITGYTCGDLFNQENLISEALDSLEYIINKIRNFKNLPICIIGLPIRKDNQLFNCAAIIRDKIFAIIPKSFIPNYSEFYEGRYFSPASKRLSDEINISGKVIPFTPNYILSIDNYINLSVEICEDLWVPIPPSSRHCLNGANLIANLSASNEVIGKRAYRESLVSMNSASNICGYVYTSAGKDESTTDTVFSGHSIIAENGSIINKNEVLTDEEIFYGIIDLEKCMNDRIKSSSYMEEVPKEEYIKNRFSFEITSTETYREFGNRSINNKIVPLTPFIPKNIKERALEIIKIQANGLAQRLKKINCKNVVIGISGGLDSTLALIVSLEAFKLNGYDEKGIIGITMPCFGTTERTKNNSIHLMDELGITSYEIDIKAACDLHYKDINHDPSLLDITFENVQARERTQILMDMANKHNALVVGTGDLSELALGWCTYNGDHMSMYAVNSSIPKTLVRSLVKTYAEVIAKEEVSKILLDIVDTPVSPELLPPNEDGTIAQKTEESIGSYVLHDFVLYYMLRFGFSPTKIYHLALNALKINADENSCNPVLTDEEIHDLEISLVNNMEIFYKRFFSQQFKRSCMPDGIKVGSICLSPRADWRMPSDACRDLWLNEIDILRKKLG